MRLDDLDQEFVCSLGPVFLWVRATKILPVLIQRKCSIGKSGFIARPAVRAADAMEKTMTRFVIGKTALSVALIASVLGIAMTGASAKQQLAQQQQRLTCPSSDLLTACQPGMYGPGGCYDPRYANCTQGIVCSNSMRVCPNGQNSYCYMPPYGSCR